MKLAKSIIMIALEKNIVKNKNNNNNRNNK